jgi:hypothetical protein
MSMSPSELVDRGPSAGFAGALDEKPSPAPMTVGGCRGLGEPQPQARRADMDDLSEQSEERRSLPPTVD